MNTNNPVDNHFKLMNDIENDDGVVVVHEDGVIYNPDGLFEAEEEDGGAVESELYKEHPLYIAAQAYKAEIRKFIMKYNQHYANSMRYHTMKTALQTFAMNTQDDRVMAVELGSIQRDISKGSNEWLNEVDYVGDAQAYAKSNEEIAALQTFVLNNFMDFFGEDKTYDLGLAKRTSETLIIEEMVAIEYPLTAAPINALFNKILPMTVGNFYGLAVELTSSNVGYLLENNILVYSGGLAFEIDGQYIPVHTNDSVGDFIKISGEQIRSYENGL